VDPVAVTFLTGAALAALGGIAIAVGRYLRWLTDQQSEPADTRKGRVMTVAIVATQLGIVAASSTLGALAAWAWLHGLRRRNARLVHELRRLTEWTPTAPTVGTTPAGMPMRPDDALPVRPDGKQALKAEIAASPLLAELPAVAGRGRCQDLVPVNHTAEQPAVSTTAQTDRRPVGWQPKHATRLGHPLLALRIYLHHLWQSTPPRTPRQWASQFNADPQPAPAATVRLQLESGPATQLRLAPTWRGSVAGEIPVAQVFTTAGMAVVR
jgi:hypothetical protein